MRDFWQRLRRRFAARDTQNAAEVERIAALKSFAVKRRAEYAAQAASAGEGTPSPALSALLAAGRAQVREAEAAHIAALQRWENRQSGQKSR